MNKWLVISESNCVAKNRIEEFNSWYDKTLFVIAMESPEIVRVVRYENLNPLDGQGRYIACIEIEADVLPPVLGAILQKADDLRPKGSSADLLLKVSSSNFRQVYSFPD